MELFIIEISTQPGYWDLYKVYKDKKAAYDKAIEIMKMKNFNFAARVKEIKTED